jgi:ACR3 family arsenite efflux pump ArsB
METAKKRLKAFERYLSLWVGLCIVAGNRTRHWFPQPPATA